MCIQYISVAVANCDNHLNWTHINSWAGFVSLAVSKSNVLGWLMKSSIVLGARPEFGHAFHVLSDFIFLACFPYHLLVQSVAVN